MKTRLIARSAPAALILALTLSGGAQAAGSVSATTVREPINPNNVIYSDTHSNEGGVATASIVSSIGDAFANATTTTGRLSGQAGVSLSTDNRDASGVFTARASGFQEQFLTLGTQYCTSLDCVDIQGLGIDHLSMTYQVHASGGVSAFVIDPRFNRASASIDYGFLLSSATAASGGGGSRSRDESNFAVGDISTQSATLDVRPGESLSLQLSMRLFAQVALASFANSGFDSYRGSAMSDFGHTLEWRGVTSIKAYDAQGGEIDLAPGGRFTLLNSEGVDFWNAAPEANAVPEPGTWALMILGFGLAGGGLRRRRVAAA